MYSIKRYYFIFMNRSWIFIQSKTVVWFLETQADKSGECWCDVWYLYIYHPIKLSLPLEIESSNWTVVILESLNGGVKEI